MTCNKGKRIELAFKNAIWMVEDYTALHFPDIPLTGAPITVA